MFVTGGANSSLGLPSRNATEETATSIGSESRTLTTTTSYSNKSFLGKYLTRRDTSSLTKREREAPKGPLGLTTLFEPDGQAVADLIFVHGLNGGSRSTWSKTGSGSFWPQDWLSCDDAFQDVRIHTFGYSSGLNRESVLNIRDFATNLLACVYHSPAMTPSASGQIIFVGHSMGGLVIKKAYILAHQIPEYEKLAERIHAMFFLATPHQGAGIAQLLSRFLALAGPRPFVEDLIPQSDMLQIINEEFPRYSDSLQLFSFFESQSMYYGIGKGLIVERDCAVMNYANERRTYLDANHRDVARFSTPKDPSYILVRNALATTIENQRASLKPEEKGLGQAELEALSKFLSVPGAPEDELTANESRKVSGSCEWLVQKDSFQQWRNALTSKLFWLQGRPGTGKTTLASHVINHLRASSLDCCYFFFTYGDESKGTISALLRSMAWQMAVIHAEVFTSIFNVTNSWKESPVDKVDHIPVWRYIFGAALLKTKLKRPQYWIIDALDECKNSPELMFFLRRTQEVWPVCILVTSRTGVETYLSTTDPSMEVISESILEDNRMDIAAFLEANLQHLPAATISEQQDISDRILRNSRGCFLWVRLVLKELRQVHTAAEIDQVLDNDHSDMNALYARILDEMSRAKFGKDLARAILGWVTCAFRSLSVSEIRLAIEADIHLVNDAEKSISTCNNLVFVDKAKKIQLIHLTAREFLTQKSNKSEFTIDRSATHKRLALVCVQTLCGGQGKSRKGSRARASASDIDSNAESVLYDYASTYLFQHLLQVEFADDEIFIELAKFLGSRRVLVWIEHLAKQADLQRLYQAGKNCTVLVTRRKQQTTTIGAQKQLLLIERWGVDLVMLVNKFGKRLSQSPSSIHHSIPPFCPSESVFRKQFVTPYQGLNLQGCVSKNWDDCLCTIYYPRLSRPTNIMSLAKRTAVVLFNNTVVIYDNATFLQTNTLVHQEYIWSISFSEDGRLFATGGAKTVRVWDLNSSEQVTSFRVPARCMSMAFIEENETLLVAAANNSIIYWDITNNVSRGEPIDWTEDLLEDAPRIRGRVPTIAAVSTEQNLVAIIYKGEDILLWTLDGEQIYDMYEKDNGSYRYESTKVANGSTTVGAVAFGSTLQNNLLVAAYLDGDVVVFDTDSGERRGSLDQINAQTIACSPDGRTLATADSQGNVDLFDLRTLKHIYRLGYDSDAVTTKKLAFTSDGLRLLNIRGGQFGVWDPTVLLRQESDDEISDAVPHSAVAENVESDAGEAVTITAMACMRDASEVICGKEDGTVHIYNISSEPRSRELFTQTENFAITVLHFDDDSSILTCADTGGRVTSRRLIRETQGGWAPGEIIFYKTCQSSIRQLIASAKHNRLLISTVSLDALWSLAVPSAADHVACVEGSWKPRWLVPPASEDLLVRVDDNGTATFYLWESLAPIRSVRLVLHENLPINVESVIPFQQAQYFATLQSQRQGEPLSNPVYHLWDYRDFFSEAEPPVSTAGEEKDDISPVLDFGQIDTTVVAVIGIANERAIFLDQNNWVCSVDIIPSEPAPNTTATRPSADGRKVVRHFFIPDDWMSAVSRVLAEVRQSGEVVFTKRKDLAVVRRGLDFKNKSVINGGRVSSARSIPHRPVNKKHITV
ncbi:hypothetical protein F5Y12DRAFT_347836 [Xylaria sp. FL1777]|nr:hypothetical protein F5Y12DRAFT_347836 [Xylaria sp. FL1777]